MQVPPSAVVAMPTIRSDKIQQIVRKVRGRFRVVLSCALPAALLGACAVSQQSEVQMGTTYASQIAQQLPLIGDPESQRYINSLGDSLARVTDQRALGWHFNIVDTKEVNAFAVPGGYVYVNRGLIERAQTMNQLAGVLAHEIGHVTLRHSIKQMQQMQGANAGVSLACILTKICDSGLASAAINITASGIFAQFSRADESQADHEAVSTAIKAGIDPNGVPEMFKILLDERKTNPSAVDAFFATHPLAEDRITATLAQIRTYPPAALKGLNRDSRAFHAFKDRLASLPPSPAPKKQP